MNSNTASLKVLLFFFIGLISDLATAQEKSGKCHALALSGGANKGSYEVGVLWGLTHYGNPEDFKYDVVSGISAGAINVAAMSVWPIGQEVQMSEWMDYQWQHLTNDTIYKEWRGGLKAGIMLHSGIYSTAPLLDYITDTLSNFTAIERKIVVAAVDVNSGAYTTFDENTPYKDFPYAVVSSASIPVMFQDRTWDEGKVLIDGGSTGWGINLQSALEKCMDIVDDPEDIILDIIQCDPIPELSDYDHTHNAYGNFMRYKSIKSYYEGQAQVLAFKQAWPTVNYRYYIGPTGHVTSGGQEMDFYNSTTYPMQLLGRSDAQQALENGPGFSFDLLEQWGTDKEVRAEEPIFRKYFNKIMENTIGK